MVDVVEANWIDFIKQVPSVRDLDHLNSVHLAFIDSIIELSLLKGGS